MSHLHKLIKAYAIHSIFLLVLNETKREQYPIKGCFHILFIGIGTEVSVFFCGLKSDSTHRKNESPVWRLVNAHKERQTAKGKEEQTERETERRDEWET